ncbi:uncharacterized protein LOC135483492 [Lineus longissimus]|uniref:uncharacterized protein LOC135483492 n=1 Tax=Lineus longissimus TaxID=88925 RepID=UPI00315DCC44
MWNLILYCIAVVVGLFLIYLFDPKSEKLTEEEKVAKKRKDDYQKSSFFAVLGLSKDDFLHFKAFEDHFETFQDVSRACKRAGLENVNLVIGVDFTASNEWQGRKTFGGNSLHKIVAGKTYNPYQKVISILSQALEPFIAENAISAYGFGDSHTTDQDVFPFIGDDNECGSFEDILDIYNKIAARISLSGPTSFAPLIYRCIEMAKVKKQYHILVIIADGQVNEEQPTINAIVDASAFPISIIVVGVGDGPWDIMEEFDNHLPRRKFDNFQFVDYHKVTLKAKNPDAAFALHALMEVPDQYKTIKMLSYLTGKETDV